MTETVITKETAIKAVKDAFEYPEYYELAIELAVEAIKEMPETEAVSREDYNHLLKIAKKMHTWIFLNTVDEDEVYKELGLSDEDNALLGSLGKARIRGAQMDKEVEHE